MPPGGDRAIKWLEEGRGPRPLPRPSVRRQHDSDCGLRSTNNSSSHFLLESSCAPSLHPDTLRAESAPLLRTPHATPGQARRRPAAPLVTLPAPGHHPPAAWLGALPHVSGKAQVTPQGSPALAEVPPGGRSCGLARTVGTCGPRAPKGQEDRVPARLTEESA